MTKVRRILPPGIPGEYFLSERDLIAALNDDGMILRAAAMLKVCTIEHHESAVDALRKCIGYFITEATGAIAHLEN